MGRLGQRLADHSIIGLDTPVFIYHVEAHPRYLPLTRQLLSGVETGRWTGVTSTITVMELTVHPWRQGRPGIARAYEALLVHFPHLILAEVTRDVARQAAQIRARYAIPPADALQVATALVHNATAFVTNDHRLKRLSSLLDIVLLDDFLNQRSPGV
jgi:predicted nucleic acid-binding protein